MTDQNLNIDHLRENFKQNILVIMNEFIPTKMINNSKRKLTWINKEIKSLNRKRNKLYKRMNQHKNTKTIQQNKDTKQRLQKETRRAY